jgi:hypothetical protein
MPSPSPSKFDDLDLQEEADSAGANGSDYPYTWFCTMGPCNTTTCPQ